MRPLSRKGSFRLSLAGLVSLAGLLLLGHLLASSPPPEPACTPRTVASARTPPSVRPSLSFEANLGQARREVRFQARGAGYLAAFSATQATLSLERSGRSPGPRPAVRMRFVGARRNARIEGLEPRVTRSHYYRGRDPSRWVSNVPHYGRLRYQELYPGIDLVFYGEPDDLEYDFVVAPGRKPETIRIAFDGVKGLRLDKRGDLLLETAVGTLRQARPQIYQEVGGQRRSVEGGYVRRGARMVGFQVGRYDPGRPLVIDPSLVFSTYAGGVGTQAYTDVTRDDAGNFYRTGWSDVDDQQQAWVTKFGPDGQALYSTRVGGFFYVFTRAEGVAVDGAGSAHFVGVVDTHPVFRLPVTPDAKQPIPAGGRDVYVAKLDPSGALLYASYLGGSGDDYAMDVKVGPDGTMYVAGHTTSPDLPGATHAPSGDYDAFVTVLASDGTVQSSTLLGGTARETVEALARTESSLVLVGTTASADFPIRQDCSDPVLQATYGGGASDVFIAELRDGELVRSTFWGGSGKDEARDASLSLHPRPATVITGGTDSPDFPVLHPVQSGAAVLPQGFLMRLVHGRGGDRVAFSTYLLGSGGAVATDDSGDIFFSGAGTFAGKLTPHGHLKYLFHGKGGSSMAVSGSHRIAIVGGPKTGPLLPTFKASLPYDDTICGSGPAGRGDGFVTLLEDGPNPGATHEQDDPAVTYTGTWTTRRGPRHSGGSLAVSEEPEAQAIIRFTGTGIQLLGFRSPRSGFLRLSLFNETDDSTFFGCLGRMQDVRLDTYALKAEARSVLLSLEGLAAGKTYRLTLTVDGTHSAQSDGNRVAIDGFNVLDEQ